MRMRKRSSCDSGRGNVPTWCSGFWVAMTKNGSRPLPEPFFVIATQNPLHQVGTFPLPESQLDRFLMRIALGYPDAKAVRELPPGAERRDLISQLQPVMNGTQLLELQK